MDRTIIEYVKSCLDCQRQIQAPPPVWFTLAPRVTVSLWQSISMGFITDLPISNGHDELWVVIDRFAKMAHFIPLLSEAKTTPDLARIFAREIWRLHGLPRDIISDRDSRFTSDAWKDFLNVTGIRPRMSTSFHPQTNGQTERINQVIEAYLRPYLNQEQDD